MRKTRSALLVIVALIFIPTLVLANSGDFSGAMAIGTSYAGIVTAPTNGLIVQGNVGIGTATASNPVVANGIVQSVTGGFKFPDGTTQTTAATGGIQSVKSQVFTASGTYTPSAGMAYASVRLIGGGGGGGGSAASNTGAGGGGAGGAAEGILTAATIGASQVVTIGAGGSGGASGNHTGNAGGVTSLGSLLTGNGGSGGLGAANTNTSVTGGAGGTASGGDIQYTGAYGGNGGGQNSVLGFAYGGSGASGIFGGGGGGGNAGTSPPTAGVSYGAGGGGASSSSGNTAGAAGSGGVVIVTEFCTQ
jgi:hypothetical protein